MRNVILFLIVFLAACDRTDDPSAATESGRIRGDGVAASYDRSFFLLSRRAEAPVTAVFDFAAVEAPGAIRRSAGAWLAREGGWHRLMHAAWDDQPMRDPWRLVPHGPLRLVVGEADEIEAVIHRADSTGFRFAPSPPLAEWGAGDEVQLRLRRGELRLGQESIVGIVLDIQTGTPVSRAGEPEVVFVTDGAGASLVVARGGDGGAPAWLYRGPEELSWDAVTLVPAGVDSTAAGWRIEEPTGDLRGELLPTGSPLPAVAPAGVQDATRTVAVEGWIEVRGDRRSVFGVLRHGQE